MIGQVLNREFVKEHFEAIRKDLEKATGEDKPTGERRRGGEQTPFELEKSDFEAALEAVSTLSTDFPHGQPSFDMKPSDRRGTMEPTPLDEYSFLCWNPIVSLLQTALEQYYEERAPRDALKRISSPLGRRRVGADLPVTDLVIQGNNREASPQRRVFDKFSVTDIRWVSCWLAEGCRLFRKKHQFKTSPAKYTIANNARIFLVGDWGTGLPRAKKVGAAMRQELAKGIGSVEQHVIHLGDVYYSGWKGEYQKRFLAADCWPVSIGEKDKITSWSLNGNHDMYSGGHGYYDVLLADQRFEQQDRSSFFGLSNDYWNILGLDTAWEDEDLKDPQSEWIMDTIKCSTRNVMLLSHHQLFSAYESGCPKIAKKLEKALLTDHVRAWFWGHEHRLMAYSQYQGVFSARCLGHGGVPVYMSHERDEKYPVPGTYEFRDFIQKGLERWALFGFAVLDLHESKVMVRYIDENGREHHSETIP